MDLPWGSDPSKTFVTNVGLITSDGPCGPNIMAAEWTHHVSYKPGLIAVCIGPDHATHENIEASKQFGVNIASSDQSVYASVAGGSTGRLVEKIKVLEALGCRLVPAKTISVLMVEGAAMQAECTLLENHRLGDHRMFVGAVQCFVLDPAKVSLAYHQGKYWKLNEQILKPPPEELERIKGLVEQYRRKVPSL